MLTSLRRPIKEIVDDSKRSSHQIAYLLAKRKENIWKRHANDVN